MRRRFEFIAVWTILRAFGALPRPIARLAGGAVGAVARWCLPRLSRVGLRNLELAFPEKTEAERRRILRRLYRNLGWQLAEFCLMARYTRESARGFLRCDGLERYIAARDAGQGVLILTAHLGAWELSSFYHSLAGFPMSMVIRRLDNPLVDALVNRIRCMHGNRVLHKDDFARGLLSLMREGGTVGILMDTNMTPPQGVFVDFFGLPACTGSGLARVAMRTGARVLPGFLLWEEATGGYVLRFGEPLPLIRSEDFEADVVANTARFTKEIERYIRQYPDQWLWVHRRWKTRPEGEPAIYS
jgi:KDO2-lipid IV(A) lauroyltransferase